MKWLKNWLFKSVKKALNKAIDDLDKYEAPLAALIDSYVKPEEQAKAVVDYIQDLARKIIDKNL